MTTESITARPVRRPLVRPAVWAFAGAMLVFGLGGSALLAWATRDVTDPVQFAYEQQAREVIGRHSDLAAKWNEFVPRFNDTPEALPGAMEAVQAEGYALATSLVRDTQAVLTSWRRLSPPPGEVETHAKSLRALELTQDGYIDFEQFFKALADGQIAFAETAEDGSAKLAEAAALWDQVRAASAGQ